MSSSSYRYMMLLLCGALLCVDHSLAQTKPFDFPAPTESGGQNYSLVCGFEDLHLPEAAKVYAAGAYSGRELPEQIDDSGHQATQIDVAVHSPSKPVALILGAYEPTIWNLGWSSGTEILAVVVSGYHRQVIVGLSASVPVLNSSYDNQGPCGYFYLTSEQLRQLNPFARKVFGREVDKAFAARKGRVVIGEPLRPDTALETSVGVDISSFFVKDGKLAGPAGLREAVDKGLIRPAKTADLEAWQRALEKHTMDDVPPVEGMQRREGSSMLRIGDAYVVMKEFTFPKGLYGAHSAVFYVPAGVPEPKGDPGHSSVLFLEDGSCQGPMCAR